MCCPTQRRGVESKEHAQQLLSDVKSFLSDQLSLELHPNKSKMFPLSQGVNALGFKIHPTHRLLRNDSKKRIKQKLRKFPQLIRQGQLSIEKANQIIASWSGHAQNGSSQNFMKSLVDRHPNFLQLYRSRIRVRPDLK